MVLISFKFITLLQSGISIPSSTTLVAHKILQFLSSLNFLIFSFKSFSLKEHILSSEDIPKAYAAL